MASFGIDLGKAPRIESGLLRRFKRQAHHYISNPPEENDPLEWLALMQHYGAPTRLLDWTYSFFVALYFRRFAHFPANLLKLLDPSFAKSTA
jgi:hypothetical protein